MKVKFSSLPWRCLLPALLLCACADSEEDASNGRVRVEEVRPTRPSADATSARLFRLIRDSEIALTFQAPGEDKKTRLTFPRFSGELHATEDGVAKSAHRAVIDTRSLKATDADLTSFLQSSDGFAPDKTPTALLFVETLGEPGADGQREAAGFVGFRGIRYPVTFPASTTLEGDLLTFNGAATVTLQEEDDAGSTATLRQHVGDELIFEFSLVAKEDTSARPRPNVSPSPAGRKKEDRPASDSANKDKAIEPTKHVAERQNSEARVAALFTRLDSNRDQSISADEAGENAWKLLSGFDANNDGTLNSKELENQRIPVIPSPRPQAAAAP